MSVVNIDSQEVRRLVGDEGAQLLEILPRDAYEALHLPAAVNVPLEALDADRMVDFDRTRPIVVYCYDNQ